MGNQHTALLSTPLSQASTAMDKASTCPICTHHIRAACGCLLAAEQRRKHVCCLLELAPGVAGVSMHTVTAAHMPRIDAAELPPSPA